MDTHGWDIVCACSQDKLNALLAKRLKAIPPTLDYSDGSGTRIRATFDPWQITSFGSDNRLTLALPIKTGTIDSTSKFAPVASVALDGAVVEIVIDLVFLQDSTATTTGLSFSFNSEATSANDKTSGAIYVANADVSGALAKTDPSGNAATALRQHVPQCLIANKDALAFALSTLSLAPSGDAAWMKPKDMQYVFVQGAATSSGQQGPGYLAVMTMVRDLDPKTRTRDVDPTLCDGTHDLCIAFNKDIFLEQVVMPQLGPSFVGVSQFAMSGDDIVATVPLVCQTVYNAGTGYTPLLTSLILWVEADELKARAIGAFDITGLTNSSVTFTVTQSMHCAYSTASNGLAMTQAGTPVSDYDKHIPWWIYVVGAAALPFLGLIIGLVVVAVVDIVVAAVSSAVAGKVANAGSNVAIGDWTTQAIQWPGSGAYSITDGGLSDALYMRGSLA